MLLLGGCDVKRGMCFKDTYVLDLRRLVWEKIGEEEEDLVGEKEGFGISRIGGKLYVYGGDVESEHGLLIMNVSLGCDGMQCGNGICRNANCLCDEGYFG